MPPRSKNATRKTLVEPIKGFKIPSQSWKIKTRNLLPKSQKIYYNPPERVTYMGRPLLRISANRNDEFEGFIYMPMKYEKLWRHLIYGALYWERAFEWYGNVLKTTRGTGGERREAAVTLRENAGVKHIQYMICRRMVLEELMKVRLDSIGDIFLPIFTEFGIRHFRDWLHDSFDDAKKGGAKYMRMDPTAPANLAQFKKGYHGKMPPEVDPPTNDDWWNGQINLSKAFARHYEDAVDVMTADEFDDDCLVLANEDAVEPERWSETHHPPIAFFSSEFDGFLQIGQDPRSHPKKYLHWFRKDKTVENMKENAWWELASLLGNSYYEKADGWNDRIESLQEDDTSWCDLVDEVLQLLIDDRDKKPAEGGHGGDDGGDDMDLGTPKSQGLFVFFALAQAYTQASKTEEEAEVEAEAEEEGEDGGGEEEAINSGGKARHVDTAGESGNKGEQEGGMEVDKPPNNVGGSSSNPQDYAEQWDQQRLHMLR